MNGRFVLNRPQGKIMGIASGLADWTGVDVLIVRLARVPRPLRPSGDDPALHPDVWLAADR